jgi:hypothetical protein
MTTTDQYASLDRFGLATKAPAWIADTTEARRVASYGMYEDMYRSVPTAFKVKQHSDEHPALYLPAAKVIIETFNRYLAPRMTLTVDPEFGTPNDQLLASQMIDDLVLRERLYSKFNTTKRGGVIRGDSAYHVWADPLAAEGSRVSIYGIHPGTLFPIYDPDNIDNIVGWHIAEAIDLDGDQYISRQTYRKINLARGPSPISYEHGIFEFDDWGGPSMEGNGKALRMVTPLSTLPDPIDHLPIYHIPNFADEGSIWGSSEIRGYETLLNAQHQNITDEDIALAMTGLGMYWTDSGSPTDADGNVVPWSIGPAVVTQVSQGKKMGRIDGIATVEPYQAHMDYLQKFMERAEGMGDVSTGGQFDVKVAESGIALELRLDPIVRSAEEREEILTGVLTNMMHDMKKWYAAFEDSGFAGLIETVRIKPIYGTKMPENREKRVEQLTSMHKAGIIPATYVRSELRRMGFEMPAETEMISALTLEQTASAQISQDAVGARMDEEGDF